MKKVLLLLVNGFEPMEMAAFTDVMAWVNFIEPNSIELTSAGFDTSMQTAFGGLTVSPQKQIKDLNLDDYDALAIPGGMENSGFFQASNNASFVKVVNHFHEKLQPIAAVCVASLCLGNTGILRNRNATIYHSKTGKRKAELESKGAIFIDRPICKDDHLITSTGPGTAIEVALTLLAMMTNETIASVTRKMMRVPEPTEEWYTEPQVP